MFDPSTAGKFSTLDEAGLKDWSFVEVALPLRLFQTLTYRLDQEMAQRAEIGARILVPLGRKLVTGYIVGLQTHFTPTANLTEAEIKTANKLIDSVPVCTPEILSLTRWVSDYYRAPWGEVIKAALPPGISPSVHDYFALTTEGRNNLSDEYGPVASRKILSALAGAEKPLRRDSLDGILPIGVLTRTLRELEALGQVERTHSQETTFVHAKLRKSVRLREETLPHSESLTEAQNRTINLLVDKGELPLQFLTQHARVSASTVQTLARKGVVEILDVPVRRNPFGSETYDRAETYKLTSSQSQVLAQITDAIQEGSYSAFLLHGVTGSGKTEVYIRAMRAALNLGRSAMMLVPEIALTPVFSRRLRAHFGDQVAIFHSSLQKGERYDEWNRVRNGDARIVIGTRSAVFAPVKNLGVIVVDEEHESTYRQQESPMYSGRDTAIIRARSESATVVLGSATPSLESFNNARAGKYRYLSLPERIGARPMAQARLIDMREVFAKHGKPRLFSDELLAQIKETHLRGEQSIILLNRRGYSSFALCRSCGETIQCPNCDVTLTYHRGEQVMICHYCNHRQAIPHICPTCGKAYMHYVGEGTEQLEELLNKLFPDIRIARIDKDTTSSRRKFERVLTDFSDGKVDMLVGTQMLAKGHDFPNVTLVGVVSVDAGLALPDFRAAERTFQLITQVAGRAGRGERPGKVLIQTYHPDHYALRHACAQDYEGFYNEELKYRQNHSYPPFVVLASILVRGKDLNQVRTNALQLRKELDEANKERLVRVLGPAPAPLARLKGEHRHQILLKSRSRKELRRVADAALNALSSRGTTRFFSLEIDPISMM